MEVTGGAIKTDKIWWCLVDNVWKRGKWVGVDNHLGLDLIATGSNGKEVSLKRPRRDEAAEILEIWFTPNGNNKKVISVIKNTALDWGSKVRMRNPSASEAWTALHTNISAGLK